MSDPPDESPGRLLVIADLDRLDPIVRECFSPHPIGSADSYLAGIAEIARAQTRAVLVGCDDACRNPQAAMAAIKAAAGADVPVVFCCEPAHEHLGQSLLECGADDYVIFPPEPQELERALKIARTKPKEGWVRTPPAASPSPSVEELAHLADLLPRLTNRDRRALDAMAVLVCTAIHAEKAVVVIGGRAGRSGRDEINGDEAVLVEPITLGEQRIGQIRVGQSIAGQYTEEDSVKLRHYGILLGRLLEGAQRAQRWRKLALTDDLTALPNRRRLMRFLEEKIHWARREQATVTVLLFDIDDFKRYNDSYGHDAGDEILQDVGRLFVQCSRESDMVARYGGDEFVVVFWDPKGPRSAGSHHPQRVIDVLQRFRKALRAHTFPRLGPEARGCLTISGGISHFPGQAGRSAQLIEAADRALLQAKEAGKNRFWVVGGGDLDWVEPPPAASRSHEGPRGSVTH